MYTKQVRAAAPTQEALDWRSLGTTGHYWRRNQGRGFPPTLRPGLFRLHLFVAFGQEHTQNISVQWLNYSSTNMVTSFFLEIGPVRETNWSPRLNITWLDPVFNLINSDLKPSIHNSEIQKAVKNCEDLSVSIWQQNLTWHELIWWQNLV